jgi:hypothetical protein
LLSKTAPHQGITPHRVSSSSGVNGQMEKQCELKRELLAEYIATLEKFKMAEREHKELLLAGTGQGVVQRSTKRVEAIKKLCMTIETTGSRTAVSWR